MMEVLNAALSFPSVIFTVLLGFTVLFWSSVILTGVDPNALDGDAGGHADAHDAGHGTVEHGDHADHGDHGGEVSGGVFSALLNFVNIGSVPVSIIFSSFALIGWVLSMLLQLSAGPWMASLLPAFAASSAVFAGAGVASFIATGFITHPLRGAFKIESRHAEDTIVDHVCTILTSKVTSEFGQASYNTKGAPLNLSVRNRHANKLTKGSQAVIIGYDPVTNTYEVGELEPEKPSAVAEATSVDEDDKKRLKEVREALRRAGVK